MRTVRRSVTIAADATKSGGAWIGPCNIGAIHFPSAWNGASVVVEAVAVDRDSPPPPEPADGEYVPLTIEAGTAITITVQAGKMVVLVDPELAAFKNCHWVRLVASDAQAAARTVYLIGKLE